MATTRKTFAAAMAPGLEISMRGMTDPPMEYAQIFNVLTSKKAFEVIQGITGFGAVPQKFEGEEAAYDDPMQGFYKVFYHLTYGLKFRVTEECFEDDQHNIVGEKMAKNLGISARYSQELLAAAIFNNGFSDTNGSPDGVTLFNANHPLLNGGFYGNAPSTAAALSITALQNATNTMRLTVNDRGIQQIYKPRYLIVPPALQFLAKQIVKSEKVLGSNNNDPNMMQGQFEVVVYDYLTSTTAWYLASEKQMHDLRWYNKRALRFKNYTDDQTDDAVFGCSFRCSVGQAGWRGVYGTAGA